MVYNLLFFSSKCSLFHNSKVFGSCIIHILYTGCAKIKKNNSRAKRLKKHLFLIRGFFSVHLNKTVYFRIWVYTKYFEKFTIIIVGIDENHSPLHSPQKISF